MFNNSDLAAITTALKEAYSKCNGPHEREAVIKATSLIANHLKIRQPKLNIEAFIANTIPNGDHSG